MSKDYYEILGVSKGASKDEIKKAFREKAHVFHPDKPGGDEKKFKEINEAYQVLNNEEKRKQYDQFGSTFDQQGGFGQGVNWEDFMRQARQGGGTYSNANFDMGDLGDIFSDLFGGGGFGFGGSQSKSRSQRGHDLEVRMSLSFSEAVWGVEKTVDISKLATCNQCQGNGAEPGSKVKTCPTCQGSGSVRQVQRTFLGHFQTVNLCPECQGSGKTYEKTCAACSGQGRIKQHQELKIKIPAGIDNNMTIKMTGAGEAGLKGSKSGDLYIHVLVQPDPDFQREGDDIATSQQINYSIAVLGGKIAVKTIDGEVELKIPAGTETGKVFRLKGKGIPRFQHHGRGDHLVRIIIQTPQNLTKKQEELLKELSQAGL